MVLKTTLALTGLNVLIAVVLYFVCWKWGHKLKIQKPLLLDDLAGAEDQNQAQSTTNGNWYIAKPLAPLSFRVLVKRINHAYLILIDKARAYQYEEDRTPEVKK